MRLNGINIADLDKKFIIEQVTHTRNATTGEQIKTYSTFATVWGKWIKSSDEKSEGDQNVALQSGKVLIRWLNGLTETMRLNDSIAYYYIKGIESVDRNITQLVKVEKRDNV
jgi:head-tail adaptor